MCGLAGVATTVPTSNTYQRVSAALDDLRHRGPDSSDIRSFKLDEVSVFLGHRRLAILDLSAQGSQPMSCAKKRFHIIFNGEIYNYLELRLELIKHDYSFATNTDTEVLLAAWDCWGAECLARLDGMFAFAVFDQKHKTITSCVDAYGVKPFYYQITRESFTFCSEPLSLTRLSGSKPVVNEDVAFRYLKFGNHDDDERTFLSGVKRLQAGHMLTVSLDGFSSFSSRWWAPMPKEVLLTNYEETVEQTRDRFLTAVKRQLRSDVPLGFALSGGLDSSAIVCAARIVEPDLDIKTFTYVPEEASINESGWARVVIDHVNARPHWVRGESGNLDLLKAIKSQGEPFNSTSIVAGMHVFMAMREAGVVVSLDGQGADETFGGYHGYPGSVIRETLSRGRYLQAAAFLINWSRYPGRGLQALKALANELGLKNVAKNVAMAASTETKPKWLRPGVPIKPEYLSPSTINHQSLAKTLAAELGFQRLPRLLRYADRNSMAASVESRVPFCSTYLADIAMEVPWYWQVSRTGRSKNLFRDAMSEIVPDKILNRTDKIGFKTPELSLLRANWPEMRKVLEYATEISFMDPIGTKYLVESYISGSRPYNSECWRVLNLCGWMAHLSGAID